MSARPKTFNAKTQRCEGATKMERARSPVAADRQSRYCGKFLTAHCSRSAAGGDRPRAKNFAAREDSDGERYQLCILASWPCYLPTSSRPEKIFQERGRSRARSAYDCKVRSGLSDVLSAVHPLRPGTGRAPLLASWPLCAFALKAVMF